MTPAQLKRRRATLGLTQAQLAQQLGVTQNTVARWEIGVRRIPELAARLVKTLKPGVGRPKRAVKGKTK